MIQVIVDKFMAAKPQLAQSFTEKFPENYKDIVVRTVKAINPEKDYDLPDFDRVHQIDDGDYQGTLFFAIGGAGYQPSEYYCVCVGYGSCSGCDTLQALESENGYHRWDEEHKNDPTKPEVVEQLMTLALHVVQRMQVVS